MTVCDPRVYTVMALDAFDTKLLHVGLPDLVTQPGWSVLGCSDLLAPALEVVDTVGATLAKGDCGVTT